MTEYHCRCRWMWVMACAGVIFLAALIPADADKPIYSYVDERGTLIATDRWEDIPERYRGRVTVVKSVQIEPSSRKDQVSHILGHAEEQLVQLIDRLPHSVIPGLTTYQSVMLICGFLAMLLSYGGVKLTNSTFLRRLMPWAVGFLIFATVYLMFVSDLSDTVAARAATKSSGSLVHQFQEKVNLIEGQEQGRLKQLDHMTGEQ